MLELVRSIRRHVLLLLVSSDRSDNQCHLSSARSIVSFRHHRRRLCPHLVRHEETRTLPLCSFPAAFDFEHSSTTCSPVHFRLCTFTCHQFSRSLDIQSGPLSAHYHHNLHLFSLLLAFLRSIFRFGPANDTRTRCVIRRSSNTHDTSTLRARLPRFLNSLHLFPLTFPFGRGHRHLPLFHPHDSLHIHRCPLASVSSDFIPE